MAFLIPVAEAGAEIVAGLIEGGAAATEVAETGVAAGEALEGDVAAGEVAEGVAGDGEAAGQAAEEVIIPDWESDYGLADDLDDMPWEEVPGPAQLEEQAVAAEDYPTPPTTPPPEPEIDVHIEEEALDHNLRRALPEWFQ
ncbi:hypothetical protein WJX74_010342 [Apatococcus lobatus]|uniref:Uncharacterized protein n=1 Tax=Apatococcus lobatus TaxID=904363 RepID=A0AAW1QBA6_9CHLO